MPQQLQMTPEDEKFARTFVPYLFARQTRLFNSGTRLVHYTSALAAINMLRTRSIWLRNANGMNDTRELRHGLELLSVVYRETAAGSKLRTILNNLAQGITAELETSFNGWVQHFLTDTYIACFSEHDDEEDNFGRLSMWRGYGSGPRVALVINNDVFLTPARLGAYAIPVVYFGRDEIERQLSELADNIVAAQEPLRARGREFLLNYTFHVLRLIMVSTKHPGFREEREWRVVYIPSFEAAPHLNEQVQTLDGVAQTIYSIPLKSIPEIGFNAEVPQVLNRVIIGPSQGQAALKEELIRMLTEMAVPNPTDKIFLSDISLRDLP